MNSVPGVPVLLAVIAVTLACGGPPAIPADSTVLEGPMVLDEVFTAWIDEGQNLVTAIASDGGPGWVAVCSGHEPRGYGFGVVALIGEDGSVEWTRRFDGSDLSLNSIVASSDGGFVVAGSDSPTWDDRQGVGGRGSGAFSIAGGVSSNYWVRKLDREGNVLWTRNYGTSADEFCAVVLELPGGDLVFPGTRFPENGGTLFRLVRAGADGTMIWDRTPDSPEGPLCDGALLLRDGSFLLGGTMNSLDSENAFPVFARVTPEGDPAVFEGNSGEIKGHLTGMVETPEGNIAVAGRRHGGSSPEAFLFLMDPSGRILWVNSYDASGFDGLVSVEGGGFLAYGDGELWRINHEGEPVSVLDSGFAARRVTGMERHGEDGILLFGSARMSDGDGSLLDRNVGFVTLLRVGREER